VDEEHAPRIKPVHDRFNRLASRAVKRRNVFTFLVTVTAATAVVTGLIAHLIDRADFPTFGIGVWWAVVTLGTVGYGDVVPHTAWGRVLGGVTIVFGVTFVSFLVAIVTSMLVEANRSPEEREMQELVRSIEARLRTIESRLER
jgi:voltage-gated potassium channel